MHELISAFPGSGQRDRSRHGDCESAQQVVLLPALQILEVAAHFVDSVTVRGSVTIGKEMRVAVVDALDWPRVPDRAPVLFPSRGDFHNVSQQPVRIRAVGAI
jgi:hypothetical protein